MKRNVQGNEVRFIEEQLVRNTVSESSKLNILGKFRFELKENGGFYATLAAPSWLSNSVYSMVAQRETTGWQFSLRAHEVVQQIDEEILRSIRHDDCEGVLKHLHSCRIGLFVYDEDGGDLLSVSPYPYLLNILQFEMT